MSTRGDINRFALARQFTPAAYTRRAATLLLGAGIVGLSCFSARAEELLTPEIIARSHLAGGDRNRLQRAFAKARRGEPLTLGVIGGSITVGAFAAKPANSYASCVLAWFRNRFPQSDIRLVNAGVGGTGSLYGTFRAQKDLLDSEPDVVIVEFAVNDAWIDGAPFEGLLRQILARPNAPAVVLLFMMWEGGGNDQEVQVKVGNHYRLPMVSFRDALWPEMAAGRVRWSDFLVDTVHPNDAGHAAAARFVTTLLEDSDKPGAVDIPIGSLPAPLHSDAFQFVAWQKASALDPSRNDGWMRSPDDKGNTLWVGTHTSGKISFDWFGTGVVAMLTRPPDDQGRVQFWIDDVQSLSIDATSVIKRDINVVAEGLKPGPHTITIERFDGPGGPSDRSIALSGLGTIGINRR